MKLGILGSTRGTQLNALFEAIKKDGLPASIEMVISNSSTAGILEKAKNFDLKYCVIESRGLDREVYENQLIHEFKAVGVEWIILIGYMKILSPVFLKVWKNKIINTHPSLLPAHRGQMDLAVHQAVIDAKEKVSGCTVHLVTEMVDAGPILLQKTCPVLSTDTAMSLKNKVQALEGPALIEAIKNLIKGNCHDKTTSSNFDGIQIGLEHYGNFESNS